MRRRRPTGGAAIVDLNLLPPALRPPEARPIVVLGAFAVVLAIAVLIPLSYRARAAHEDALAMEQRANAAEQALGGRQANLVAHRALTEQLASLQRRLDQLRGARAQVQGGRRVLADDLAALLSPALLPPGSTITTITGTARGFRVEGTAAGPLDAITFAERAVRDGQFASAGLVSFAPAAAGFGKFDVEVAR